MVRGNWQRRVELNDARRNEAKLKKQRNEERRVSKAKLNELLTMMDRNKEAIWVRAQQQSWEIHLWTDTLPSDAPPVLDMWEDNDDTRGKSGSKRRNRSASIENENAGRKNATPSGGKKKAHPRSKETVPDAEVEASAMPRLCRYQFFTGKCTRGGKKGGGCRHVHYPKKSKTIAEVLNAAGDTGVNTKELLKQCQAAHPDAQEEDNASSDSGSIEMVYYSSINLKPKASSGSPEAQSFSDVVGAEMAKKSCGLGSIVYLAVNENLFFDRFRDGIVMSESEFLLNVCGVVSKSDPASREADNAMATALPGPVLENILTFLPDSAVAIMGSVCRAWNLEIGTQSVHFWKFLLERRAWPLPSSAEEDSAVDNKGHPFRQAFLSHYSVLRDVNGLKTGMAGLLSKKPIQEKETCFRSFENSRGAPQYPNPCVSVDVWSPNQVLVSYAHDCTLRMFDTVKKTGSGDERFCREILCLKLDPYKNTKKRNCQIVGLALDSECIGCLFEEVDTTTKGAATILRVLGREDFLLADDSIDEDVVKTIDVRQSILLFLLSCDDLDDGLLQLNDFFTNGGDMEEVEVLVSQSIAACGYGRFLVEASISIPLLDATDDDSDTNMTLLFRRLFIISSGVGAIMWMCASSPPSRPMRPRLEQMTLASRKSSGDFLQAYRLASGSARAPAVMSGCVGQAGDFDHPVLLEGSDTSIPEVTEGGWEVRPTRQRPMIVLDTEVVAADTFARDFDDDRKEFLSFVSFYPTGSEGAGRSYDTIQLGVNWEISSLVSIRDDHIIAFARRYITTDLMDDLDGHWFGDRTGGHVSLYAIILHVSSRTEMERICLVEDLEAGLDSDIATSGEIPFKVGVIAGTVGAAVWWKGLIMTGQEVRLAPESAQDGDQVLSPGKQKKKKKKTPKKGGKKDGFARGMSLRG